MKAISTCCQPAKCGCQTTLLRCLATKDRRYKTPILTADHWMDVALQLLALQPQRGCRKPWRAAPDFLVEQFAQPHAAAGLGAAKAGAAG